MLDFNAVNNGDVICLHFAVILGEGSVACYRDSYRKVSDNQFMCAESFEDFNINLPRMVDFRKLDDVFVNIDRPNHIFVSDSREGALERLISYEKEKQKLLRNEIKESEKKIEFSKKIMENALKEKEGKESAENKGAFSGGERDEESFSLSEIRSISRKNSNYEFVLIRAIKQAIRKAASKGFWKISAYYGNLDSDFSQDTTILSALEYFKEQGFYTQQDKPNRNINISWNQETTFYSSVYLENLKNFF